jgi:uncharacterized protein (TIGR03435 family)
MRPLAGVLALLVLSAAFTPLLLAQAPAAFDAVSIKRNTSGGAERSFRVRPGQIVATNVTVRHVIWNAFNVQDFEVSGGPGWLSTERFDITAKSDSNPTPDQMREMLRTLLADRFNLKAHRVQQDQPIYVLVIPRSDGTLGPQLIATPGPCDPAQPARVCGFSVGNGTMASNAATIPRLAEELTGMVERRVVDRTGLTGLYQVRLQWAPDGQAELPSLFTAVQEQLGLKLEPQRGPANVLVIDSAERPVDD